MEIATVSDSIAARKHFALAAKVAKILLKTSFAAAIMRERGSDPTPTTSGRKSRINISLAESHTGGHHPMTDRRLIHLIKCRLGFGRPRDFPRGSASLSSPLGKFAPEKSRSD